MTGWLIALGIVIAIAILPIGASFCYDESGPRIKLIVGPVKVLVFPRPKKAEKEKQKDKKGIAARTGFCSNPFLSQVLLFQFLTV